MVLAQTDDAAIDQAVQRYMQKHDQHTKELEQEVSELKQQVKELKTEVHGYQKGGQPIKGSIKTNQEKTEDLPTPNRPVVIPTQAEQKLTLQLPAEMKPVVVAPYYGIDASAVVVTPTYNQDVKMLQQRKVLEDQYSSSGLPEPPTPLVELSGRLEGQASATSAANDINLSSAELDVASQFNPWVLGYFAFAYDNSTITTYRVKNSRVYLDRGFITIGNLNQSPFYGTIGQRYVPFGQYNNFMIAAPLTQPLGRVDARSFLFGYQHPERDGIYSALYVFRGDSKEVNSNPVINNAGFTLGYDAHGEKIAEDVGIDVIRNMADAEGMQQTNNSVYQGFGQNSSTEILNNTVPGIAVHGKVTYLPFTFIAEYVGATKAFSAENLAFNYQGAKPRAYDLEAAYNFKTYGKESSFALGYDRTYDALALWLPQQTYVATYNVSIWENTIASLELMHAINYPSSDTASGQGVTIAAPTDHTTNMAIARFAVYF